jgi:hypothetical protein
MFAGAVPCAGSGDGVHADEPDATGGVRWRARALLRDDAVGSYAQAVVLEFIISSYLMFIVSGVSDDPQV